MSNSAKLKLSTIRIPLMMVAASSLTALIGFPSDFKLNLPVLCFLFAGIAYTQMMAPQLKNAGLSSRVFLINTLMALTYFLFFAFVHFFDGDSQFGFIAVTSLNLLLFLGYCLSLYLMKPILSVEE